VSKTRCCSTDPDKLFVRGAAQKNAAAICRRYPIIAERLADALDNQMEFDVSGGMTERQRQGCSSSTLRWSPGPGSLRKHRNAG
jgi:WhiB family redox-sensing transcriptional regulator